MTHCLEQVIFCCIPVMYLNQQGLDVTFEDLAALVSDKQIRIIDPYVYIKEKAIWEATGTMESSPPSCTSCLLSWQNWARKTLQRGQDCSISDKKNTNFPQFKLYKKTT